VYIEATHEGKPIESVKFLYQIMNAKYIKEID
jgi:hypothetical protein